MYVDKKQTLAFPTKSQKMFQEVFGPLFSRTIGFEDVLSMLDGMITDVVDGTPKLAVTYPPYNYYRKDDNTWQLEFALAGFKKEELNVELDNNILYVYGEKSEKDEVKSVLYHGFAKRKFKMSFPIQSDIEINDCTFVDGVLTITLVKQINKEAVKQIAIK